jgi:hypothetical protein
LLSHNNKVAPWQYEHGSTSKHLLLEDTPLDIKIYVKSDRLINVDQLFTVEIIQLMEDVRDSVLRHGGYLDQVETNTNNLLDNFEKAIEETYLS